jgi:hypothetical protein
MVITLANARRFYESHETSSLAQADPTPQAVRQAFLQCAGEDGALTVDEAVGCATEKGFGNKASQIRARWP